MIISVALSGNVSISFPIDKILDNPDRLLLVSEPEAARQLKSGLACTLFSKKGNGYEPVRQGLIRSVEESKQGVIVSI